MGGLTLTDDLMKNDERTAKLHDDKTDLVVPEHSDGNTI